MKLLVCLSLVLVVTTAQEQEFNIFDIVAESMKNGTDYLKGMVYESVIEEDGSGYKILIQSMLDMVEPQFCPSESVKRCVKNDNWLLGCKCRKAFDALGECSTVPCRVFSWIKNEGPEALSKFFKADTYEKKAKVLVDYLVKPMGNLYCECPRIIRASSTCAKKYDGKMFEMFDLDHTDTDFDFEAMMDLDWKALQGITEGFLKVICEQNKGENCMDEFGDVYIKLGTLLDNTFSGQDICNSMIRAESEFTDYMLSWGQQEDDLGTYLEGIVDAYVDMEHEFACNAECADEIQQIHYNSCCMKSLMDRFLKKDMSRNLLKFIKSYTRLMVEEKRLPNLKPLLKKYLTLFDLEKFCGDGINAYRNFNEQCNAIEA